MRSYLPIGTVVRLKGRKKKAMIVGHLMLDPISRELFDYCAVDFPCGFAYPEGKSFGLDFNDIESINFIGYINDESEMYINRLSEVTSELEEEKLCQQNQQQLNKQILLWRISWRFLVSGKKKNNLK